MAAGVVFGITICVVTSLAEDIPAGMKTCTPRFVPGAAEDYVSMPIGVAVRFVPASAAPVCTTDVFAPCPGHSS